MTSLRMTVLHRGTHGCSAEAGQDRLHRMGLVTFDLFSALIDSRSGGSSALTRLAADHRWDVEGGVLYDVWDAHNKASQRDEPTWVPFAEHCRRAMSAAL